MDDLLAKLRALLAVENREPFRRGRWGCRDMQYYDEDEDDLSTDQAPDADKRRKESMSAALEAQVPLSEALAADNNQQTTDAAVTGHISNKIEAAMDLVKSHLMFAVKEEIEVMKEEMRELRIQCLILEDENKILRGAADTHTLSAVDRRKELLQQLQDDNDSENAVALLNQDPSLSQALAGVQAANAAASNNLAQAIGGNISTRTNGQATNGQVQNGQSVANVHAGAAAAESTQQNVVGETEVTQTSDSAQTSTTAANGDNSSNPAPHISMD